MSTTRSVAAMCALLTFSLALVACGGGGGGGAGPTGGGGGLRALFVDSTTPPSAQLGLGYAYTASASGGTPPYTFGLAPGSDPLPVGLAISPSGRVSGTPIVRGESRPRIQVVDSTGWRANAVVL